MATPRSQGLLDFQVEMLRETQNDKRVIKVIFFKYDSDRWHLVSRHWHFSANSLLRVYLETYLLRKLFK